MSQTDTDISIKSSSEKKDKTAKPPMYKVIILNDDYTTMDFVVGILVKIFRKTLEKANKIMLNVHRRGKGICGLYTREIAETKIETVHALAQEQGYPLKCTMEKE
ncbi:MAG: ATP-dependent Clp protease adapter ClpS [Desulfobacteraceae bacterium]|nr:ATP-dependent Clp protease adapter ClpS [Desulfobacteraceae bacterium]